MWLETFNLKEKNKLTHDVFELIFELREEVKMLPGQFITFILPKIWWRAYSILEADWKNIKLIIKRREEGRWWSKFICDLNIWDTLTWVLPAGHFILREEDNNKIFFWTGTWFVPLFNQIKWAIERNFKWNLKLIFWLREEKDLFYIEQLKELKNEHPNFDFEIFLSREEVDSCRKWYVTDYIKKENIIWFDEFYICWMHMMIDSVIEKVLNLWVKESKIITEKY